MRISSPVARARLAFLALAFSVALTATGCSTFDEEREMARYEQEVAADNEYVEQRRAPDMAQELPSGWRCFYDPTWNENWHDDVLCTNGVDSQRPLLRQNDSFITEDEMREAARAYEAQLNAGR